MHNNSLKKINMISASSYSSLTLHISGASYLLMLPCYQRSTTKKSQNFRYILTTLTTDASAMQQDFKIQIWCTFEKQKTMCTVNCTDTDSRRLEATIHGGKISFCFQRCWSNAILNFYSLEVLSCVNVVNMFQKFPWYLWNHVKEVGEG